MAKKRVHEIAKERGISSKEVIATLQKAGLDVKAAASSVDADDAAKAFNGGGDIGAAARERAEAKQQRPRPAPGGPAAPAAAASAPRPWPPAPYAVGRARPDAGGGGQGGSDHQDRLRRHRQGGCGVARPGRPRGDQEADGARRDGDADPDAL